MSADVYVITWVEQSKTPGGVTAKVRGTGAKQSRLGS
jgi:hypothetical protein